MFGMITLKPYPFCGGKAMVALGRGNCAVVFCGNGCSVEMKSELNMGKYEAIPFDVLNDAFTKAALMWNTRKGNPTIATLDIQKMNIDYGKELSDE